MKNSLRADISFSQNLALGALSSTVAIGRKFKLEQIIFHASVAITENITITYISAKGSSYNSVIRKLNLSASQDASYIPTGENNFQDGDSILIECTNANTTGVLYCVFKSSEMLK